MLNQMVFNPRDVMTPLGIAAEEGNPKAYRTHAMILLRESRLPSLSAVTRRQKEQQVIRLLVLAQCEESEIPESSFKRGVHEVVSESRGVLSVGPNPDLSEPYSRPVQG